MSGEDEMEAFSFYMDRSQMNHLQNILECAKFNIKESKKEYQTVMENGDFTFRLYSTGRIIVHTNNAKDLYEKYISKLKNDVVNVSNDLDDRIKEQFSRVYKDAVNLDVFPFSVSKGNIGIKIVDAEGYKEIVFHEMEKIKSLVKRFDRFYLIVTENLDTAIIEGSQSEQSLQGGEWSLERDGVRVKFTSSKKRAFRSILKAFYKLVERDIIEDKVNVINMKRICPKEILIPELKRIFGVDYKEELFVEIEKAIPDGDIQKLKEVTINETPVTLEIFGNDKSVMNVSEDVKTVSEDLKIEQTVTLISEDVKDVVSSTNETNT